MRRIFVAFVLAVSLASAPYLVRANGGGFDAFGFNEKAHLFNGTADGVDRVFDGKVWGDPIYANDHLVMNWNAEWERGLQENWRHPPYAAWQIDNWNGQVPGGSGQAWHYKIQWDGSCKQNGVPTDPGATCMGGQFSVLMDQGTFENVHYWYAHGLPAGLGN